MTAAIPFLKWAGGKRWATDALAKIIPSEFNRYFEPFLGGGAFFFRIGHSNAHLSDLNVRLIDTYRAIQDDWRDVQQCLQWFHDRHCKDFYYQERAKSYDNASTEAARFIYLNRSCWNGLYRENSSGAFNVPIGTKQNIVLPTDNFETVSRLLKGVELVSADFEIAIEKAEIGDVIYADPPYTTAHNFNGFVKYNQTMFSWDDQVRLRDALLRASARGVRVIVSNADHASIRNLYDDFGTIRPVSRASVIAASSTRRGRVDELVITNY